jgi:hypothetical protein
MMPFRNLCICRTKSKDVRFWGPLTTCFEVLSCFSIIDFLASWRGAELRDKIEEVIIKNTCFQYERSLAEQFLAHFDQERFKFQNDVERQAEMTGYNIQCEKSKKLCRVVSFGNTK